MEIMSWGTHGGLQGWVQQLLGGAKMEIMSWALTVASGPGAAAAR